MRKIRSMADVERIRRRNSTIMGVVFIFLLVVSTAGFAFMSSDSEDGDVVSENGFDFFRDGGLWRLAVGDDVFGFQNLPSEVMDVEVNVSVQLGTYNGQPLYFVNPGEGTSEILGNMGKYILRYQEACFDSGDNESEIVCEGNLPVKDCSNNLILFEAGNETRVDGRENCVFIVGDSLRGSDAFLYEVLGVN